MADTDNRLLTQTNAKTTTRAKKAVTAEKVVEIAAAVPTAEKK